MTREEAIGNLKYAISWNDMPIKEVMMMAIKALEQEPCDDAISRQVVYEVLDSMLDDSLDSKRNQLVSLDSIADEIAELPSVNPQEPKIVALLEKTYADFCKCEGGEGWLKIDGKEYYTDVGYAIDGMRIFMEVFKQRLAESEG